MSRYSHPHTKLVRVVITKRSDGLWDVVRERAENGETLGGYASLSEALDAVEAHERSIFCYPEQGELFQREGE